MSTRWLTRPNTIVVVALMVALGALTAVALAGRSARPTAEQQAHDVAATLHCPVCKDLSAADSPAPLARQMRAQIRHQLAGGATPAQIRQGFVSAYGASVLMSPPNQGWGRVINLAPLVLLAGAGLLGASTVRRGIRSRTDGTATGRQAQVDDEARRRLEDAMARLRRETP